MQGLKNEVDESSEIQSISTSTTNSPKKYPLFDVSVEVAFCHPLVVMFTLRK